MTLKTFTSVYKSVWGTITAIVAVGPLAMSALTELTPPWPRDVVGAVATLACVIAVMLGYLIADWLGLFSKHKSRQQHVAVIRRTFLISVGNLILAMIALLAYVNFYSMHVLTLERVVKGEPRVERWVVGTERFSHVNSDKPNIQVLQESGFVPSAVWKPHSLRKARISVLSTYIATFVLLTLSSMLIAAYVYCQRRQKK